MAAARHLEALARAGRLPRFQPPSALELGSGTGLAGLAAAIATGLPTTLTDLKEVLPALQRNAQLNAEVREPVVGCLCPPLVQPPCPEHQDHWLHPLSPGAAKTRRLLPE